MDSRCEILIEKIYKELENRLKSSGLTLEALDDYFYEYEKEELEDILEDITLNYLNRREKWVKRIIEENLEGEETYEDSPTTESIEKPKGEYKDLNYNDEGYDKEGYDIFGWSKDGYHKTTKTKYNKNGYDMEGYNVSNWSKIGHHRITGSNYDENGYDEEGYNILGWSLSGNHKMTKTNYNEAGYDIEGWNESGFNVKTASTYDQNGLDRNGNKKNILKRIKSTFSLLKN